MDDLLVYRLAPQHFMLVVNASHIAKDYAHIAERIKPAGDAVAVDASSRYALIAVQGPRALEVIQPLTAVDLASMKYYWFAHGEVAGVRATVSRTGYTGEDGYEIFVAAAVGRPAVAGAARVRRGGRSGPVRSRRARHAPARSGDAAARQRHRRNDHRRSKPISDGSSAGRSRTSSAPNACAAEGGRVRDAKLVGFEMLERGIARRAIGYLGERPAVGIGHQRHPDPVSEEGDRAWLTCPAAHAAAGSEFDIDIRGRRTSRQGRADAFLQKDTMMAYPAAFKYSKDHEWIEMTGDRGKVGITDYAQQQLGDVVYVELPGRGLDGSRQGSRSARSSR